MEARQSTEKPADSSPGLGNKKIQTGESPVLFPSLSPWPAPDHGSSSGHRNQILLLVEFVFTPLPECFTLQILILTKLLVQVLSCPALAPICFWAAWPSVRIFGLGHQATSFPPLVFFWKAFFFLESQLLFLPPLSHVIVFSVDAFDATLLVFSRLTATQPQVPRLLVGVHSVSLSWAELSWVCGWLFGVKFRENFNQHSCVFPTSFPPSSLSYMCDNNPERILKLSDSILSVTIFCRSV